MGDMGSPTRRALHTSPDIGGSLCDRCRFLDVIDLRDRVLYRLYNERPFEYRCTAMSKKARLTIDEVIAMTEDDCPVHRGSE